ncbi:hypothetical protein KB553_01665 [Chryseobacterium rhizoplanae]|uniref:hypothetical protein n=1 Tax=Chryseobacterium rhizoplanae TaxID=1609531 RepID=UPI001CE325EE|nr:hypothetical protein [Chryseobacterium rhizoplanae]UCA60246.1 hypothetical protein KB553_01665 [Chryseobacterium rhizoplanae]
MESQKQNEESKSSGMELLENVIKSNERNIASNEKNMESNAELNGDMEDLVLAIGQLQLDLEVVKEVSNEVLDFYDKEQVARNQFLASIPTKIETVPSQETIDFYQDFKKTAKRNEKFTWSGIGVAIFAVLVLIISINFATNWYKESIKAKSELRQDILNEIAAEGKKIYDENEIKILKENTNVMQLWIKNNPKKAEDFLQFKDGFEAKKKE